MRIDVVSSFKLPATSFETAIPPQIGDLLPLYNADGAVSWWKIVPLAGAHRVIGITTESGAVGRVAIEPDTPPPPQPR